MKLIYLKSAFKFNSFDITIGIKIPFFRVLVTIEPSRSLLQLVTTNCLILTSVAILLIHSSRGMHIVHFQVLKIPFGTLWKFQPNTPSCSWHSSDTAIWQPAYLQLFLFNLAYPNIFWKCLLNILTLNSSISGSSRLRCGSKYIYIVHFGSTSLLTCTDSFNLIV